MDDVVDINAIKSEIYDSILDRKTESALKQDIVRYNAMEIPDRLFITSGILGTIWVADTPMPTLTYMNYLCDGRLWGQLTHLPLDEFSFLEEFQRAILYNHPVQRNVHDVLDMLGVESTHAYGMLLLRYIVNVSYANQRDVNRNNLVPLQYAATLPHVSMEVMKLLVQGGARVFELTTLDTIFNEEIRIRLEEEILRMMAEYEGWYNRMSPPLIIHLVEHNLSYILEGGPVRDFTNDDLILIRPWYARILWLNDYLFHKCSMRQLPRLPSFIVIKTPLMHQIWSMLRREIRHDPTLWDTFFRPFLDICLEHTHMPFRLTLPLVVVDPPARVHPNEQLLNNYILQRAGYTSGEEIRAVKEDIRRPERLNWLQAYYT